MPVSWRSVRHPLPDVRAGQRVEADGGLVEHQQRGPVDQRLSQLEAADHPSGVGAHQAVAHVVQPHHR